MSNVNDYINYFYEKYHGRVAISVGYNQDLSEVYPFVFQSIEGESIGIVALGLIPDKRNVVYIYHLGAFITQCGDGSKMLKELCHQADNFKIHLSVSAVFSPNGNASTINTNQLVRWYQSFGFMGESGLLRSPKTVHYSQKS